ncbi:MAG: tRNA (5-methylaminomethyl-2-thiouridine)(34)-methyltransferase MnmD [Chloroflexia bacterium]|nr:tRNA (5-methylaminomethyl-2-thiouridine)(34)-methyltransferase MnmD [Chloroflexia bacterium]
MNFKIIQTNDGSNTIYLPDLDETYHSKFGAINEAQHIFIDNGLAKLNRLEINVLEVGFGTGLNALLTLLYSERNRLNVNYITIEKYPLPAEIVSALNYSETVAGEDKFFVKIHELEWERTHQLSKHFTFKKVAADILDDNLSLPQNIDLIYFDAFAPSKQAEIWGEKIFKKLYDCLSEEGKLVTYSSAGIVKQALRNTGFLVKRLQGPPGKHHMLFCSK